MPALLANWPVQSNSIHFWSETAGESDAHLQLTLPNGMFANAGTVELQFRMEA